MNVAEALQSSGLADALIANGRAMLTPEAAEYAVAVSRLEPIPAGVFAFTHCCENSFNIFPPPNANGHPEALMCFDFDLNKIVSWDIGPLALNFMWSQRSVCAGEYSMIGLKWTDVFGKTFYEEDRKTPCKFSGDPIANGRLAARKILATKGNLSDGFENENEMRAVRFTGPDHQGHRLELYRALIPAFSEFFSIFTP